MCPFDTLGSGHHFADDIFIYNILKETNITVIQISPKFVSYGPVNNIAALIPVMDLCSRVKI